MEEVSLFTAFPNPVGNEITLKISEFIGDAKVRIFDVSGRLVHRDFMTTKEKNIQLPQLEPGTYFLNLEGKDFKQTIKLIKS